MKHNFRKLTALLLAVVMVLCMFPVTAIAAEPEQESEEPVPTPSPNGYIRVEHPTGRSVTNAYLSGDRETYDRLTGGSATKDTLPSQYDSRELNIITSVKNQNPFGSCWAHAAMACVETYMIYHNVPVGTGSAATTDLNLSESHHCWFNYTSAYDAEGMLDGDASAPSDNYLDQGGNGEMSSYTLMRWTGAASESESALKYPTSQYSTVVYNGLDSKYAYDYDVCHVQNCEWILGSDIEAIKRAIMKYGAGNISYCAGMDTTYTNTYQCVIDTTDQDDENHMWSNHAITVIGWDDTISASKFKPNKPSSNGAWLCKNSWGTGYFDQGYMYISYEDTSVCEDYIYFMDAEPIDNYQHNYQYDGSCNVVCYGKGWLSDEEDYVGLANNSKVANVFTAKGNELLRAVALCNWNEGLSYTLEIYKNPTMGNPSSGTLMTTQEGLIAFSGYYTIPLETPVELSAGDTFSVVFTQSSEDGGIFTPYDATLDDEDIISWCSFAHADHGATSYYKEPNGSWTDCPDNGDYRIKAYTDDRTPTATVNFVASGTSEGSQTAAINSQITLPTTVSVQASGWTFSGWTDAQFAETESAPAVFYQPGVAYTVTGDTTLYAVFTRVEASDTTFERVTAGTTDWSGRYVITNGYDYNVVVFKSVSGDCCLEDNSLGSAPGLATTGITIASGSTMKNVAPEYIFTIAKNGSYYTIKSATNCWIGIESSDLKLHNYTSNASGNLNWNISYDSSTYNKCMKIKNTIGGEYPYLANTGLGYFEAANSYTDKKTYLWKETSQAKTYYYTNPIGGLHVHTPEHVEALAPTCVDEGHTAYYRCTDCGKLFSDEACQHEITLESTVLPATGIHTYGSWTANNNGTHKHTCSVCGNVETANCSYTSKVTAPTCTEQGYTTYTCSACNYSYQAELVSALGHSWGEWSVTTEPNCTDAGVKTRTCSRCNTSETQSVDALGHDYVATVTEPTCTAGGYTTHTCSRCSSSYTDTETAALGHAWNDGEVTKEPTEDEDGERTYTCTRCQITRTEVIPRLSQTNPFVDVKENKYYYDAVLWAYYHDPRITSGTDATHFSPNAPCTREQIVFFLWAASGKPAPTATSSKFTDVKANKYYYDAVLWATENGITNGISDSLFGVGKYCTREQIVTFLWRCADSPEPTETNSFTDVPSKAYYAKAVSWAVEKGITGGTSATTFSPKKLCTRAEVVTFLYAAKETLGWN